MKNKNFHITTLDEYNALKEEGMYTKTQISEFYTIRITIMFFNKSRNKLMLQFLFCIKNEQKTTILNFKSYLVEIQYFINQKINFNYMCILLCASTLSDQWNKIIHWGQPYTFYIIFIAINTKHESGATIRKLKDKISELEEQLMTNIPTNIKGQKRLNYF